jgi:hypothetical protein
MKNSLMNAALVLICGFCFTGYVNGQPATHKGNLKVVIIRHAEKPLKGDNLDCQGLNRSLQLPAVLHTKFGIPDYTYVPLIGLDTSTRHSRMFQTIIPFAAKYNIVINSKYEERDSLGIAADIKNKEGVVLLVWEHKAMASIVRALGVQDFHTDWGDNDYDSIWIITFSKGVATFTMDKERLLPATGCPF